MPVFGFARLVRSCGVALLLLSLAGHRLACAQMLDLNGNGVSDVWEQLHGAGNADPNGDSDLDGVPDRLEAVAGTDPFNAGSVPRISQLTVSPDGARANLTGVRGKRYELQASETLCGTTATNWY